MDKCPKCCGDSRENCEWELMYGDDGRKCDTRSLMKRIRELEAEVQRLREAGREVVCVISRCSCEKCADLARRRWQEVDPR